MRTLTVVDESGNLSRKPGAVMEITDVQKADKARWEASCKLFATLPGADRLITKYGRVPTFHDGEVEAVHLTKKGPSKISISIPYPDVFGEEKVLVTLTAAHVLDVELEGFSGLNVIDELWVRIATAQPDHPGKGVQIEPGDLEIEFDPIFGIGGKLLLRNVDIGWSLKRPRKSATA